MNPFDLSGIIFLVFYLVFGIAVVWGVFKWIDKSETGDGPPAQNMTDPYLIAYLRSGENEALRVATVALLDRGLLIAKGEKLQTKSGNTVGVVQRPIEKAILKFYVKEGEGHEIFKNAAAKNACDSYAKVLKDQRMLASASTYAKRFSPVAVALGVLLAITWTKISIAFSQGHHNVGFLIMLTFLFGIVIVILWRRRRTALGDDMMNDLKSLFSRLKDRSKTLRPGGQTNEAALLAAVFGISVLSASEFPFLEKLYPRKATDGSSCGSSSSCSSGSSCSGGSSCGGGGGCGGCGS